ncbi:phosphatase PAP2 family protein [Pontibacter sp. BT310]|uniref:Phosphatase PAP2 family protein n=1 Tax=Pontibacter populi TaxID=890055 RepID=A0ABS6X755_9BACT|nr:MULTISPECIES: phosphatase PAP2 family protein [Pontibacter]MBJ6116961.1 phosphatase PAP2 family protein [Pontibacter sp. BT310]MBR0569385.1 phosphatase PAP2 family protein [Microvirga sp. STS03]MBW3363814.1 phosphatase PAP2 family protein [Pontibacter populi]
MKRRLKRFLSALALLSVEAVLVWAVFFGCVLLFVYMAELVFVDKSTAFDEAMFRFAASHSSTETTRIMRFISFFASADYLMVVPVLIVLIFAWFRQLQWFALKVLVISFTSTMLNQALKRVFERPRPETAILEQSGLSFPSGHAMIGGSFYGLLIYIVWRTVPNPIWRWLITIILTLLLLLIGYSRVYLNVHYATDVLAGYSAGIRWLLISIYLMRKLEKIYFRKVERKQV